MSSSLQGKADQRLRLVSEKGAIAVPESVRPTDDAPTVISKTPPIVAAGSSTQDKIVDLARKSSPESIVASLRGRHLAHYELIEPIGVGGMAAVIRARDTQLDRFVALKILPPEMSHEPDNIQRFHQEAKAAAKLDHENIARVFYCGEDQGLHFIAFEYVEGINLRAMLEERGRVPVAEAVRYILQVATGLEHAATRGVVHRDVKPSNIIITPTGRAKLVDMGLARNLERRGQVDLTQSGMTLGTFDYISPEQALEPREADMRSDIYSLGCTLYHLLTGQAPVPEGTPAKKLYHHQHLAPVDPRQIDPGIPDEIVMILSKMMAKNPRDRYQRPIHLVHHLMQVAQKVGAADDLPEGVLFVDAPLPGQPRNRPLLFIGMALAALVLVTVLLSLAPDPAANSGKGTGAPKGPDVVDSKGGTGGTKLQPTPIVQGSGKPPPIVKTAADMRNVLADHAGADAQSVIAETINLETAGIVYHGSAEQVLTLEAEESEHAIVRFQYKISGSEFGLTIEGGKEVVFRRIHFQTDCDKTPDRVAAAVAVRGARIVRFEQCIFSQVNVPKLAPAPKRERVPLASVLIQADSPREAPPTVYFTQCYFEGNSQNDGQVAVAINGPANVYVTNTAFKPHSAFISFRDKCSLDGTMLDFKHCAGLIATGPAFRFAKDAAARVRAEDCVFSRPGDKRTSDAGLAQPGLIYLAGTRPIVYEGRQNLYHALNDFAEYKEKLIGFGSDYQKSLKPHDISDVNSKSIELTTTAPNPLAHADPLHEPGILAFQLTSEYARPGLGLQKTWLGDKEMPRAAVAKTGPPMPKKIIVDAEDNGKTPGVFANLAGALAGAQNDDVIYIKHGDKREVMVPPVVLRPTVSSVTIKPYEGFQPILVLERSGEKDATLFRLQKGRLQFEQLEFLLDPGQEAFDSQSVVHLGEAGHCIFKQCVITLRTEKVQLSAVTFIDLERMMKMDSPAPGGGRVEFHECFIRGKGDLVSLRGCRLLHVDMKNSLVALDGSLLDITAADKAMAMEQGVRWKMERSSVFTTDSIFALRCMTGVGLTKTEADIKGCLFVSLLPERPVVLLDMKNSDLGEYLGWKGEQNYYANFDKDKVSEWKSLFSETRASETKAEFGKVGLPKLNDENRQLLWDAELDWFRPGEPERIQGFGLPADSAEKLKQLLSTDDPS